MSCSYCATEITEYGADPAIIQWKVVRGDTAELRIDFLEDDEVTYMNTTGWVFKCNVYDSDSINLTTLSVLSYPGYINIIADPSTTQNWGDGYKSVVKELPFDLQITLPATPSNKIWTPVIGTICVLGDVTPGGSL